MCMQVYAHACGYVQACAGMFWFTHAVRVHACMCSYTYTDMQVIHDLRRKLHAYVYEWTTRLFTPMYMYEHAYVRGINALSHTITHTQP